MNKSKYIILTICWLFLVLVMAAGYKFIMKPAKQKVAETEEKNKRAKIIENTSASSRYDTSVDFAIDSFCGFAALRSPKFKQEMDTHRIKINFIDDGADYSKRIKAFKSGDVQMGVFTIDALIKSCSDAGGIPPATVVAFVDETRGADAMVAYNEAYPNIDSLNDPETKFVLPGGPSETLARVVMSHFKLNNMSRSPFVTVNDAKDVFDKYKKSKPDAKQVYVLWEPWVSKMVDNPNVHVVVDSSKFHGYIIDVIVANRDFLAKNPETVQAVTESYFRSLYAAKDTMPALLMDDGKLTDQPLSAKEAANIVKGVWWKNTLDNYGQMGLESSANSQHIEDIIANITRVLIGTGSIPNDPTNGKPGLLYFNGILKKMHDANFRPGIEQARNEAVVLKQLTDEQWKSLMPIGRLDVPPLSFVRGTADLTGSSTQTLSDLTDKLKTWPTFYVVVKGTATREGDLQANTDLAKARSQAAVGFLVAHGIEAKRIHSIFEITGESSVTFFLGEPPY